MYVGTNVSSCIYCMHLYIISMLPPYYCILILLLLLFLNSAAYLFIFDYFFSTSISCLCSAQPSKCTRRRMYWCESAACRWKCCLKCKNFFNVAVLIVSETKFTKPLLITVHILNIVKSPLKNKIKTNWCLNNSKLLG